MSSDAESNPVPPQLFIILGGTGDLNRRKLLPALFRLGDAWPAGSHILGVARSADHDDASYEAWAIDALTEAGHPHEAATEWCRGRMSFVSLGEGKREDYARLADAVKAIELRHEIPGNRIFYLALPPGAFPSTIRGLGGAGLDRSEGKTRLVVEKPFGRDLESALELNQLVHRWYDESQIYRIDHYLGKETVQNLLAFRFANAIFEPLWNRDHIESVQITVAESLGIEGRGSYYDRSGALRDMVQNHLTQLLTLIAMEVPAIFDADSIRAEKVKVLHSIETIDPDDIVFGQYTAGAIDGHEIPAYREERGVAEDSNTETFVAGRIAIDNWRWQGVPFYFRTGKAMPEKLTQIAIVFRRPPVCLFEAFGTCMVHSNALVIRLQPEEGVALYFDVKVPGSDDFRLTTLPLQFRYADAFQPLPDAYQTLCLDVITEDQTLFVHANEVETSWRLFTPLLERSDEVLPYAPGTWGPDAADQLLLRNGHSWRKG